jgi:hypothetical protein
MTLSDAQLDEAFALLSRGTDGGFLATNDNGSSVYIGPTADRSLSLLLRGHRGATNPQVVVDVVQPDRQVLQRVIMADYAGWRCLVDDLGVSDATGLVQDPSAPDRTSAEWREAQRRFAEVIEEDLHRRRGERELGD